MTRYAKPVLSGQKQAEDATSWASLKQTIDTSSTTPKAEKKRKKLGMSESLAITQDKVVVVAGADPEDRVVKKLRKKKKNKKKLVEEAVKTEISGTEAANNNAQRRKQGKGSQKFSNLDPEIKKQSRADVHKNRRASRNPCFVCRSTRHKASNCPKGSEKGVGICFKCASTEHTSATCTRRDIKGFPHAKCFICNETGHLSKECPDNPRGLYPNGGCCKECGAVEHFAKDCPTKVKKKREQSIRLKSMKSPKINVEENDMMDLDDFIKVRKDKPKPHQPKIVKF